MILVLDNYDSFTYNLVQYLGELGVAMEVRRNDETTLDAIRALKPERILVSPGPCSPRESGLSNDVRRRRRPRIWRVPGPPVHRPYFRRGRGGELPHDAREDLAD